MPGGASTGLKLSSSYGRCANDDFDEYFRFHLDKERHRVHETRYAHASLLRAA